MAQSIPQSFQSRFMKEGTQTFKGIDAAVIRNIEAVTELATQLKSSYGPHGMNKLIINDIGKEFVTTDASTTLTELDIVHPAAKLLALAAQYMHESVGDGVNLAVQIIAGLLDGAVELLSMGLKPIEITNGYTDTYRKVMENLPNFYIGEADKLFDVEETAKVIRTAIMGKQYAHGDFLAKLVAEACVRVAKPQHKIFNVDNIRIVKIVGDTIKQSQIKNGMVFQCEPVTPLRSKQNGHVAVFACPFEAMLTETKGTVLMTNAAELVAFSKNEEGIVEEQVKALKDAGYDVVVAAGKFSDLHIQFLTKYDMVGIRITSKFDLRRLCRTLGVQCQARIGVPPIEGRGELCNVNTEVLTGTSVVVVERAVNDSSVVSIVIRGPTHNRMAEVERALDDGINTYKAYMRDARLVAGGGAFEIQVARYAEFLAHQTSSVNQFAMRKFSAAFESIAKQLAQNAGLNGTETVAVCYAEQKRENKSIGIDITGASKFIDVEEANLLDSYLTKATAISVGVDAACQILQVDQIIMAKQAGGPPAGGPGRHHQNPDGDDDGMA